MSNLTIFGIEEEIKQNKAALAELEKKLELAKLESPDRQLAKELHGLLCTWNHTDGCSWYYEISNKQDNWSGHAHSHYLQKAQSLIRKCEQEGIEVGQAISMFRMVKGA